MREILFKAKRADNGEWVEGDLVRHYENQRRFIACDQMAYTSETVGIKRLVSENSHEVIPETIGQYTGLVDKNGKKIYENDIVIFLGKEYRIIFECGTFGLASDETVDYDEIKSHCEFYSGVQNDNFLSLWDIYWNFNDNENSLENIEICGNIHDKE